MGGEERGAQSVIKVTSPLSADIKQKASLKAIMGNRAIKFFVNQLFIRDSIREDSIGDSRLMMESEVFAMGNKDDEIIEGVIVAISVNVMDDLAFSKGITEMGFHNRPCDSLAVSIGRIRRLCTSVYLVALWGAIMKGMMLIIGSGSLKGGRTCRAFDGKAFSHRCVNPVVFKELADAGAGNAEDVAYFLAGKVSGKIEIFKEVFCKFFMGSSFFDGMRLSGDGHQSFIPTGTVSFHGRLLWV